ncbi:hypothetical protein GS507_23760 [Rhodococcus hoagii]|nr:hypothetical protein [Prescottella equi]
MPANIAQYVELRGELDIPRLHRASARAAGETGSGYVRLLEVDAEPRQLVDTTLDDTLSTSTCGPSPIRGGSAGVDARRLQPRALDLLRDRPRRGRGPSTSRTVSTTGTTGPTTSCWTLRGHHVREPVAELYSADVDGVEPSPNVAIAAREGLRRRRTYRSSTRFTTDRDYWLERVAGVEEPRVSPAGPRRPRR